MFNFNINIYLLTYLLTYLLPLWPPAIARPDAVYFHWYILNVNKVDVVAYFSKIIWMFLFVCCKVACLKFQTKLRSLYFIL